MWAGISLDLMSFIRVGREMSRMSAAFVVMSSSRMEPSVTVPPAAMMRIASVRMLASSGGTADVSAAVSTARACAAVVSVTVNVVFPTLRSVNVALRAFCTRPGVGGCSYKCNQVSGEVRADVNTLISQHRRAARAWLAKCCRTRHLRPLPGEMKRQRACVTDGARK